MATKTRIKLAADAATEIAVGSEWELFFPWSLAAPPAAVVFSVIGVYTTVKDDKWEGNVLLDVSVCTIYSVN